MLCVCIHQRLLRRNIKLIVNLPTSLQAGCFLHGHVSEWEILWIFWAQLARSCWLCFWRLRWESHPASLASPGDSQETSIQPASLIDWWVCFQLIILVCAIPFPSLLHLLPPKWPCPPVIHVILYHPMSCFVLLPSPCSPSLSHHPQWPPSSYSLADFQVRGQLHDLLDDQSSKAWLLIIVTAAAAEASAAPPTAIVVATPYQDLWWSEELLDWLQHHGGSGLQALALEVRASLHLLVDNLLIGKKLSQVEEMTTIAAKIITDRFFCFGEWLGLGNELPYRKNSCPECFWIGNGN